jgi:hypothetical protein
VTQLDESVDAVTTTAAPAPPRAFVPAPPPAEYTPAAVAIDPDQSKGWIRRLLPVLRPHRTVMIGMFAASLVMLGMQLSIPQVVRAATDNALIAQDTPLGPYIWALVVLGIGQFVFGYVQRFGMQRAAFELESKTSAESLILATGSTVTTNRRKSTSAPGFSR